MHHPVRFIAALCLALALPGLAAAQPDYRTWYLAEGSTGFFEQEILIGNPNAADAQVTITYLLPAGQTPPAPQQLTVRAFSRATVRVNDALLAGSVSARVESSVPIVVERSMYWGGNGRRGGHNTTGVVEPRLEWFLAEGVTNGIFQQYILVANPNATAIQVEVTFLGIGDGLKEVVTFPVGANGRLSIDVAADPNVPNAFRNRAFSARVRSLDPACPIIVERAIYWGAIFGGGQESGGTNAAGLTSLSDTWLFAEGSTGADIAGHRLQTFLLLVNPNDTDVVVDTTFFLEGGGTEVVTRTVRANARENIWVNQDEDVPASLLSKSFSIRVRARNGAQIAAERAVYWGPFRGGIWREGHTVSGIPALHHRWAFAEGIEDRVNGVPYDTFFLLNNPNDVPSVVRATFVREDGTGFTQQFTIAAQSRYTLWAQGFPQLSNQRFAAFFDSVEPIAAERAVYWGQNWHGGHASAGVPWFETFDFTGLPAPPAPTVASVSPAFGTTNGGTDVTVKGTNFAQGAWVVFGNTPATHVTVLDAETIVATTPGRTAGTVDVTVNSGGRSATRAGAFLYESPAPPPPPPPPPGTANGPAQWVYPQSFPYFFNVVQQVANERRDLLLSSCVEHDGIRVPGGNNEFMFEVVRRLRAVTGSNRWGLNWKRGTVGDLSQDIVTYFYGPEGVTMEGRTEVFIIDIIGGHCGSNPGPNWQDQTFATVSVGAIGRWTTAGRTF